ncbi:MAG: hypothetical protein OIN87_13965, partial [Candidatus Methanoperedens sp.]|nr:hypothetical protein [Candidatus Methanoperedens sp.]
VGAHNWSNISIYAYNSSGTGTLNTTPATQNIQVLNNLVTIENISSNYNVTEGQTLFIYPTSSDLDGDTPVFDRNFTNGTFYPENGTLIWTTSNSDIGILSLQINVTDGHGSISFANFIVTVNSLPTYNASGYVFNNFGAVLEGVLVQNGSNQSITSVSGYYSIIDLLNGIYNFSYSKEGFNTDYLEITINGADNSSANKTIYDTTPPASIINIAASLTPLYINWTWTDPSDTDFDHVEVYIDGTFKSSVTKGIQFYNASYFEPNSTHIISTRTVDNYGNVNANWSNDTAITPSVFTYVFDFLNNTGTVSGFSNAKSDGDSGASSTFAEETVVQQGNTIKYANVQPVMTFGTITSGDYSNTISSDNSYLVLTEETGGNPANRGKLDTEWNGWEAFFESGNSSLTSMNIGIEASVNDGDEVYIQLWNYSSNNWSASWNLLGTLPSSDTVLWYNITNINEIQTFVNTTGNFRIRFADAKVAVGSADALQSSIFSIDEFKVIFNYDLNLYHLNVTTNTTNIPEAVSQELQLRYNVSNDNFILQIWNGSTWNNRTTLNDTVLSYRNITLFSDELISYGTMSGNDGNINTYYILVRYQDMNASTTQQGSLYLDYQRIYNN